MPLTGEVALLQKKGPVGPEFPHYVAAGVRVFRGGVTAICKDGTAVPPQTKNPPSPMVAIGGIADDTVDNTGTSGLAPVVGSVRPIRLRKGCWAIPFDTAPTWANYGAAVYAADDATVSLTQTPSGGSARLQVGTFAGLDEAGNAFVSIF